jgi:hypothetical protein
LTKYRYATDKKERKELAKQIMQLEIELAKRDPDASSSMRLYGTVVGSDSQALAFSIGSSSKAAAP